MQTANHEGTNSPATLADALSKIVGMSLSSVTFVADYVQFAFNGPGLTAFNLPVVTLGSKRLAWDEPGYRDALCEQIDRRIEQVEVDDRHLAIRFEGNAELSISLIDEDYSGPEALIFSLDRKEKEWVV